MAVLVGSRPQAPPPNESWVEPFDHCLHFQSSFQISISSYWPDIGLELGLQLPNQESLDPHCFKVASYPQKAWVRGYASKTAWMHNFHMTTMQNGRDQRQQDHLDTEDGMWWLTVPGWLQQVVIPCSLSTVPVWRHLVPAISDRKRDSVFNPLNQDICVPSVLGLEMWLTSYVNQTYVHVHKDDYHFHQITPLPPLHESIGECPVAVPSSSPSSWLSHPALVYTSINHTATYTSVVTYAWWGQENVGPLLTYTNGVHKSGDTQWEREREGGREGGRGGERDSISYNVV